MSASAGGDDQSQTESSLQGGSNVTIACVAGCALFLVIISIYLHHRGYFFWQKRCAKRSCRYNFFGFQEKGFKVPLGEKTVEGYVHLHEGDCEIAKAMRWWRFGREPSATWLDKHGIEGKESRLDSGDVVVRRDSRNGRHDVFFDAAERK